MEVQQALKTPDLLPCQWSSHPLWTDLRNLVVKPIVEVDAATHMDAVGFDETPALILAPVACKGLNCAPSPGKKPKSKSLSMSLLHSMPRKAHVYLCMIKRKVGGQGLR